MKKYERKLQKYNKLLSKYEEKVRKIAQKFTEDLCKAIGAEQIYYGTDKNYTHIIFEDIQYQSGSHDLDYYRGREPTLKEYLEVKIDLENKNEKMIYETLVNKDRKVLENGEYNGYKFWIISYGSHPCAYVELQNTHPYYGKCNCDAYDLDINVHGGITYGSYGLGSIISDKHFILGWDYNHYNDYNYYNDIHGCFSGGKKWTTEEIFEDVKDVIHQLHAADVNEKVGGK